VAPQPLEIDIRELSRADAAAGATQVIESIDGGVPLWAPGGGGSTYQAGNGLELDASTFALYPPYSLAVTCPDASTYDAIAHPCVPTASHLHDRGTLRFYKDAGYWYPGNVWFGADWPTYLGTGVVAVNNDAGTVTIVKGDAGGGECIVSSVGTGIAAWGACGGGSVTVHAKAPLYWDASSNTMELGLVGTNGVYVDGGAIGLTVQGGLGINVTLQPDGSSVALLPECACGSSGACKALVGGVEVYYKDAGGIFCAKPYLTPGTGIGEDGGVFYTWNVPVADLASCGAKQVVGSVDGSVMSCLSSIGPSAISCPLTDQILISTDAGTQCVTPSGDLTTSQSGVGTVHGWGDLAVGLDASSGAIEFSKGRTAPGLYQAMAADGSVPVGITLAPQAPNPGTTSATLSTPGSVNVNLAAPGTSGNEAAFVVNRGGSPVVGLGGVKGQPSVALDGIWFGSNVSTGSQTAASIIYSPNNPGFLTIQGTTVTINGNPYTAAQYAQFGYWGMALGVASGAGYSSGVSGGALGLVPVAANPSTAVSGSGSLLYSDHTSGDLCIYPPGVTAPVADFGASAIKFAVPLSGAFEDAGGGQMRPLGYSMCVVPIGDGGKATITLDAGCLNSPAIRLTGNLGGSQTISFANANVPAGALLEYRVDLTSLGPGASALNFTKGTGPTCTLSEVPLAFIAIESPADGGFQCR